MEKHKQLLIELLRLWSAATRSDMLGDDKKTLHYMKKIKELVESFPEGK